jgi:hypothetical protein
MKHKSNNSLQYKQFTRENDPMHPKIWWQTNGYNWSSIAFIALQVFSLCPTSASAEITFSAMTFIHSKLRNRLTVEKVKKLIYIRTNTAAFSEDLDALMDSHEE